MRSNSILDLLDPPQLLSAGPIPHSFDVTRHRTNPNTTVYGREYFSCHKYDFPYTVRACPAAHIVIRLGAVLECLELIPESVNDLVGKHCLNSRIQVRTRWHMKTSDYLFNCITVSPVNWFLTSVQTDSIRHNAQAAIEYSCSMRCLRLFQCQVI